MCGIVGYVGRQSAAPILMQGLHRLEYRGYDSSGIALAKPQRGLSVHKKQGKIAELESSLPKRLAGKVGIGHTRWATHGAPSDHNAHPHLSSDGSVAVVHNGIVENARELRSSLENAGIEFSSETDSEVLAHLIATSEGGDLETRVRNALNNVTGTYGLLALDDSGELIAARNGSPVVIGIGDKEMFIASDASALVRHTQQVVFLEDGEVARIDASGYSLSVLDPTVSTDRLTRNPTMITWGAATFEKGDYEHYMLKEIEEQPDVIAATLRGRLDPRFDTAHLGGLELGPRDLQRFRRVQILGCGSAYISGMVGARMLEKLTRLPADAVPAAEFRYRNPIIDHDTLYIAVSQSGETFDTLAAVQEVQRKGGIVLGIVNVVGSSIARECARGIYLHAGPEISVVSTKTFAATLTAFALLALYLGRMKDLSPGEGHRLLQGFEQLPGAVEASLATAQHIEQIARRFAKFDNAYFIGRDIGWALAMEGALKLKEVSYIHAEAYPASELKHGPLALVSPDVPTVAILPDDELSEKNVASLEEIRARKGPLIAITHREDLGVEVDEVITVPAVHPLLDAIPMLVPLQLLAYYAALARGRNVDQPRNLAKSVTVE